MAFEAANRVKDFTTTSGTGPITLAATPPTGFNQFNGSITTGSTCHYCIVDGANYEIGLGTFTEPATLARTRVIETKVNGIIDITAPLAITLSGNTAEVFITKPAQALSEMTVVASFTSVTTGATSFMVVVPMDGYLESIFLGNEYTTLTASDTEYLTFALVNKGIDGVGTTSMLTSNNTTKTTVGHLGAITQYTSKKLLLSATYADLAVSAGQCLLLTITTTTASTLAARVFRLTYVFGSAKQ